MTRRPRPTPTDRDHLIVFGAVGISLLVIGGLWLYLLPGQLQLTERTTGQSSLWEKLQQDGQDTVDAWSQTVQQIDRETDRLPADQALLDAPFFEDTDESALPDDLFPTPAHSALSPKDLTDELTPEEIDRFRNKLEAVPEQTEFSQ